MSLLPGKIPPRLLEDLLAAATPARPDPRVLVGPRPGEDAAVLDFGDTALVVATDPVTFAAEDIGWYAVHVNANDVAIRGARPRWFLAVLLLPESSTDNSLVSGIFRQIASTCASLDCSLIGGHSEITLGLDRPIVVGQMLGEVAKSRLVTTGGAKPGDVLLLAGPIAIEGTAILARTERDVLLARGVPASTLAHAADLLFDPGISVVKAALAAHDCTRGVHSMHDPTEGGLVTGVTEVAQASGLGVRLSLDGIPVLPECSAICRALDLDPLGLLASGALLLAVDPGVAGEVIRAVDGVGVKCVEIGRMVPREQGLKMETKDALVELPTFDRDEIARALEAK
jgi:hydrogenase maturation factor